MKMTKMHGGTDVSGLHRRGAPGPRVVADGKRCDRRSGATKCASSLHRSLFRNQGDREPGVMTREPGFFASQGLFRI